MGGGCSPQRNQLSSPSGIVDSHLIILVRHKHAQMCPQSDPKCYEQIFVIVNFLMPHSLTDGFSQE